MIAQATVWKIALLHLLVVREAFCFCPPLEPPSHKVNRPADKTQGGKACNVQDKEKRSVKQGGEAQCLAFRQKRGK